MDRARLAALVAIILWGISFVATKAALRELAPVPLIFGRLVLGVALLLAILAARGERLPRDGATWRELAWLGFVGVAVHLLLQAVALTRTSAVHTGWLIGLIPIWSAILAALFLGERLNARQVAGFALGFAGALLVMTGGRLDAGLLALPSTQGDLLVLVSTVNWAVYTILGRRVVPRLGARVATAGAMTAGTLMLAPLFFAQGGTAAFAHLSPGGWAALLFLGLGCSGLGYLLWYGALEKLEAGQVAVFLYLEPLVTLAAAAWWLDEPIGIVAVVGGVVVLAGVSLVQRRAGSRAA
jgi:drug/metabolite transporter (DMT)-like permease